MKIVKTLGLALAILALSGATSAFATSTPATVGPCMSAAVAKRDTAIATAVQTADPAIVTALQTRSQSIQDAWNAYGTSGDKTVLKSAIAAAWSAYKTSVTAIKDTAKSSRQAAWTQFHTDRLACGGTTDGHGSGSDGQL